MIRNHVIIVAKEADTAWAGTAGSAVTMRDYVREPERFARGKVRVVNLSGDYAYLDFGDYRSLLAEARGHRVLPSVASLSMLQRKSLYAEELPELNAALRQDIARLKEPLRAGFSPIVFFGQTFEARYGGLARKLFDRIRCPLLRVEIELAERWQIRAIEPLGPGALGPVQFEVFLAALESYTRASWTSPRRRRRPRYWLAVLHNPKEALPPSSPRTLQRRHRSATSSGSASS